LQTIPNQRNMLETFTHFNLNYDSINFSKISQLFYGTYKKETRCHGCYSKFFDFKKFELISFDTSYYIKKRFNLYDGFQDNAKPSKLVGDNQFFCSCCRCLRDAETTCKVFEPPIKLLINVDCGKNKGYKPSSIEFDELIDITQFIDYDYKIRIKYRLIGVCTQKGASETNGHYVAYCKNNKVNKWYEFDDSSVRESSKNNIIGYPHLLFYERIYE